MVQEWSIALEAAFVGLSGLLFFAYHALLVLAYAFRPQITSFGNNVRVKRMWARQHVKKVQVLPIQALRNYIMSCTVLASTTLVLVLFLADSIIALVSGATKSVSGVRLDFPSHNNATILVIKEVALVLILFVSFLNFMQAVRAANHMAFLLTIDDANSNRGINMSLTLSTRMSFHWWAGLRYLRIIPPNA
eukprot:TRINITY_DN8084_c0_g1_i2.p1 TRINITY_DN8084_c0_g1~~TRINITY_DN8084_c0_g1_i2.p1  ORF type:complete len:191 (+),score=50.68 TRINITY_DN8084_c0_g1_i2:282-854(+)